MSVHHNTNFILFPDFTKKYLNFLYFLGNLIELQIFYCFNLVLSRDLLCFQIDSNHQNDIQLLTDSKQLYENLNTTTNNINNSNITNTMPSSS